MCDTCQKIKRTEKEQKALLIVIKPQRVNQLITTDLAGPFKETVRGNKYYLVIDCHFSKFIQLYALKNIQTELVTSDLIFFDAS